MGSREITIVPCLIGSNSVSLLGGLGAGMIDEDFAHGFGGGVVEMTAALPLGACAAGHLHERFVHQCGGLEGVIGALVCHELFGPAAQRVIDDRIELGDGLAV